MIHTTVLHLSEQVTTLAIDDTIGTKLATTFTNILRPLIIVAAVALALYFAVQKQFSKVWTVVIIGAVVFALTIGTGDTSLIGRLAKWISSWFG